jgi:hypothetical protein
MGSRWSRRRRRLTTTMMMMMMTTKTTTWRPDLASVRTRGWARGSPSQPPGGLAPSVLGAGTPRSRSEKRRQAEGVLDPLAEMIGVTPGGQAEPHAPQEQVPALAI